MIKLRHMLQSWTALAAFAIATPAFAADKLDPSTKPLGAAQCEQLVEQLANPSKPPFTKNYVHELPKGVTESGLYTAQKPIAAAYNALSANIEASLPVLATHVADDRFSYVYEEGISGTYQCETVGGVCRKIIGTHVNVYRTVVTKYDSDGRSKSLWFIEDECGGIEEWWKGRRGRSLAELQLEGIEWASHHPKPAFLSSRKWAAAQESLDRMAGQIRETKTPIHVKHKVQFFSK